MKIHVVLAALIAALGVRDAVCAMLPSSERAFPAIIADPPQPAYSAKLTAPENSGRRAEITMGDEIGLAEWNMRGDGRMRLGIVGAVAARFDVSRKTNDMEIADYTGALPVDYAFGAFSARIMYWHTSSHLGDDYIKRVQPVLRKNVTDDFRFYVS